MCLEYGQGALFCARLFVTLVSNCSYTSLSVFKIYLSLNLTLVVVQGIAIQLGQGSGLNSNRFELERRVVQGKGNFGWVCLAPCGFVLVA